MLRVMGVAAALLAVACSSTNRRTDGGLPAHDQAAGRDAALPPVDEGPLPMLEPLELQRTLAAGTRLEVRAYGLPDGSLEEDRLLRLRDRELDTLCRAIPGARTFEGELRCMPAENEVGTGDLLLRGRFLDDACTTLALADRPARCSPRFVTEVLTGEATWPYRVMTDGASSAGPVFVRSANACVPDLVPDGASWVEATPVPESAMVRGEDETRALGDLLEVTRTYDDGTVVLRRELAEPCRPLPASGAETTIRCAPGFSPRTTPGLNPGVAFLDAECTQPIARITADGWALLAANGASRRYVIFDIFPDPVTIHPVLSEPFAPGPEVYRRDDEEGCFSLPAGDALAVRLGAAVPHESFPSLTRVTAGGGRLRAYRWADAQGRAWPVPVVPSDALGLAYLDRDLGLDCAPVRTGDGLRCLPRLDQRLFASQPDGNGQLYADEACTVRVAAGPASGADYLFERVAPVDDCRVTDVGTTPAEQDDPVVRAWAVGAAVGDAQTYRQFEGGRCEPFRPTTGSTLRRVGDEVPLSTFAEMSIETVP